MTAGSSEFHDEALAAAKATLTALQAGQTLLQEDFRDEEKVVLEEAAKALGIAVPWDPAEAAQIAKDKAEAHARSIVYAQQRLAQALLDELSPDEEERLRKGRAQRLENASRELERLKAEQVVAGNETHNARKINQAHWEVEKRRGLLDGTAYEQSNLRKLRVEEVESARQELESLLAGAGSVNATA